jgi:hypothetical protein
MRLLQSYLIKSREGITQGDIKFLSYEKLRLREEDGAF